jgi:nitrogen fixation NifU-like protein
MSLTDAYRTVVLDHNRTPRRRGRLPAPSIRAEGVNALCGDKLSLELAIEADVIAGFAFEAEASALTLAATSIMGDLVCGRGVVEATALADAAIDLMTRNPERVADPRLGEFNAFLDVLGHPNRIKTITLPWATLAGALNGRLSTSTDVDIRGGAIPPRPDRNRSNT